MVAYYSDVTWATGFTNPTGTPIPYNPASEKSPNMWANARTLYYNALKATNQSTRENNFAQMFKALGQDLHLLQDMSVPAHVRNDFRAHLIFNGLCDNEGCHYINILKWFGNPFEYYIKMHPTLVDAAGAANVTPTFTNSRLTDFWDTNQYNGTIPSNSKSLGLAEITNANYFTIALYPIINHQQNMIIHSPRSICKITIFAFIMKLGQQIRENISVAIIPTIHLTQ